MLPSPPAEMQPSPSYKRKRGDIESEELRDRTFQLENLSTCSFLSFEPVNKLLRAHLPLSWLGSSPFNPSLAAGTLLVGEIKNVSSWEYSVLVARQMPNGGLVALEKVEPACFVVHPLQPFVSEKWVTDAAIGAAPPVSMQMMLHYLPETVPAPQSAIPIQSPGTDLTHTSIIKVPKTRRGTAARLSILSATAKSENSSPSPLLESIPLEGPQGIADTETMQKKITDTTEITTEGQALSTENTASTVLIEPQLDHLSPDYLRRRYLEFLYLTREPVTFFTKGPLNRARARARADNATMSLAQLADFYRESILPAKKMDLKYKESLTSTTNSFSRQPASDDEQSTSKSKRPKRTKLGQDGLWPMEPDIIRKWWHKGFDVSADERPRDACIRDRILALRMREAELQIVLMLEALSIEVKQHAKVPEIAASSSLDTDDTKQPLDLDSTPKLGGEKRPKRRNLETDIEALADKLCIWHSIGLEGDFVSTNQEQQPDDIDTTRDRLKNFCTDVLITFYNSKLPVLCKSLCKILAGPELYDGIQKETRIRSQNAQNHRPGAAIDRRVPSRSGTLERALSADSQQQSFAPSLIRSTTLPPIPSFKREGSESHSRPHSRQQSVSFTNREVDFEADAKATASKKRKLDRVASQKQDLAAAIQGLRKPNRNVVSQAYMDEVEQRKLHLKRPVLITATPKTARTKDMIRSQHDSTPASSTQDFVVPSSSFKPANLTLHSRSSSKKRAVLAAIHDTPSRGVNRNFDPLQLAATSASYPTPLMDPDEYVFATPTKSRPKITDFANGTNASNESVCSREKENCFQPTDLACRLMDRAMAMPVADDIYDTLGWNDDEDI